MKGANRFLKVISTVLVHSFLLQQLAYAAPDLKPIQLDLFEKPKVGFKIPESVAVIEDAWRSSPNSERRTIYLIQDAHANESGQINLARTLDIILRNERSLRYVFVEAGVGDDSLSFLRPYAAMEKRREVALSYIKSGLLHGEEYLDMISSRDFKLWGVEDLPLYIKAIDAYRYTATERGKFESYLNQIENTIKVLKPRVYNPWLLSFDAAYEKYLKEETSLTDFFEILTIEAEKRDISLTRYPHLVGLKDLKEKETKIDFKKANEEQIKAVAALSAADQKELLELAHVVKSPFKLSAQDHKEEKAYYAYLEEKIKSRQQTVDGSQGKTPPSIVYPELFKYFDYLKLAKKIQAENILKEEKQLEESIFARLAQTPDERSLLRASKNLRYLRKLFLLTMTPEEFADYKAESQDFDITHLTGFLNKKIMDLKDFYENAAFLEKGFDKIVARAEEFYTITQDRDEAFLENMFSKMSKEFETTAVLITGGYHAPNLKSLLKSKNISYVSIRPQVFHETNQKKYEKLLLNQQLDPALVNHSTANANKLQSPSMQSMARLAAVANMPDVLGSMAVEMGVPLRVLGVRSSGFGVPKISPLPTPSSELTKGARLADVNALKQEIKKAALNLLAIVSDESFKERVSHSSISSGNIEKFLDITKQLETVLKQLLDERDPRFYENYGALVDDVHQVFRDKADIIFEYAFQEGAEDFMVAIGPFYQAFLELVNPLNALKLSRGARLAKRNNVSDLHPLTERIMNASGPRTIIRSLPAGEAATEENDGVFLIKPTPGLTPETISEILNRIEQRGYEIVGAVVYDGSEIERAQIMQKHYERIFYFAFHGALKFNDEDKEEMRRIYDVPEFGRHFGQSFDETPIFGVYQLIKDFSLSLREAGELWNQGQNDPALFRNGRYDGVNHIGLNLSVFPTHSPKVLDGKPFFIVNGYYLDLVEPFKVPGVNTVALFIRGIPDRAADWNAMREELVGPSDPSKASAGSIRGDAYGGALGILDSKVVKPSANVAHLSAGPLETIKEARVWFGVPYEATALGKLLIKAGYTAEEIEYFLTDPFVRVHIPVAHSAAAPQHERILNAVFSETEKLTPRQALDRLMKIFPPYYRNQDALPTATVSEYFDLTDAHDQKKLSVQTGKVEAGKIHAPSAPIVKYTRGDREVGERLIGEGKVGEIVLGGGTGGRMFGYDVPERERIRGFIKPLVGAGDPLYADRSAFELQAGHNQWTRNRYGGTVQLWVFTSATNRAHIEDFFRAHRYFGLAHRTVGFYSQGEVPRWNPTEEDLKQAFPNASDDQIRRWIAENGGEGSFFRLADDELSYKTFGHLDGLNSFVLSGEVFRAMRMGLEYLFIVDNTNLAGFLDPGMVGYLERHNMDGGTAMVQKSIYYHLHSDTNAFPDSIIQVKNGEVIRSTLSNPYEPVMDDEHVVIGVRRREDGLDLPAKIKKEIDKGGSMVDIDGKTQILEGLRFPPDYDQSKLREFASGFYVVKLSAVAKLYGIPYSRSGRKPSRDKLYKAIQNVTSKKDQVGTYVEIRQVLDETTGRIRLGAQPTRLLGEALNLLDSIAYFDLDPDAGETFAGYINPKSTQDIALYQDRLYELARERTELVPVSGARLADSTRLSMKSDADPGHTIEVINLRELPGANVPSRTSYASLHLAERADNGKTVVIKKLIGEEYQATVEGDIHHLSEKMGERGTRDPRIYNATLFNAGKNSWAGLEDGIAVVYDYEAGAPFDEYLESLKGLPSNEKLSKLLDIVSRIVEVSTVLEKAGVQEVWDFRPTNIIVKPDGDPYFIDYTRMNIPASWRIHWFIVSAISDLGFVDFDKTQESYFPDYQLNQNVDEKVRVPLADTLDRLKRFQYASLLEFGTNLKSINLQLPASSSDEAAKGARLAVPQLGPTRPDLETEFLKQVENSTPAHVKENKLFDIRGDKGRIKITLLPEHLKKYDPKTNPQGLGLMEWLTDYEKEAKDATAGIRSSQNVLYPWDTRFRVNQVGVALATLGKALVAKQTYPDAKLQKIAAGEVRYNTPDYVELIARIQAAQGIRTYLPKERKTTTIWMTSFLTFMYDLVGAEFATSSHANSSFIATKDIDSEGSQYLSEESVRFVRKIREIFETVQREGKYEFEIASADDPLIDEKLMEKINDGADLYTQYLKKGVATDVNVERIRNTQKRILVDNVGGALHRATAPIFERLGIDSSFEWMRTEQDPFFHGIGKDMKGDKFIDYTQDTTIIKRDPETGEVVSIPVMERMGYDTLLKEKPVGTTVLMGDPDGDRLVTAQIESSDRAEFLGRIGVDYLRLDDERILALYTPNQSFFLTMAYQAESLKAAGLWDKYPRFIIMTTASSAAWREWAKKNGVHVLNVPVGFKEIAAMQRKIEYQMMQRPTEPVKVRDIFGEEVDLGVQPRMLFAGEESGGAVIGPEELIRSINGRIAIGMREKSDGEMLVIQAAMAVYLESEGMMLSDYLSQLFGQNDIKGRYDVREDVVYYNQSEPDPDKLKEEKEVGEGRRTANYVFYLGMALAYQDKKITKPQIISILNGLFAKNGLGFDDLSEIYFVGDGVFFSFPNKVLEVRPSGTDAKSKSYAMGEDKLTLARFAAALGNYGGEQTDLYHQYVPTDYSDIGKAMQMQWDRYQSYYREGLTPKTYNPPAVLALDYGHLDARMAAPEEINRLIRRLKSPWFGSEVRGNAALKLGEIGRKEKGVVLALVGTLQNQYEFEHVRRSAAMALGQIGPEAVPALVKVLKDNKNKDVREYADWALRLIGRKALDEDVDVRRDTAKALQGDWIWPMDMDAQARSEYRWGNSRMSHILRYWFNSRSTYTIPDLIRLLREDPDLRVRRAAAEALGQMGPLAEQAVPALIEALSYQKQVAYQQPVYYDADGGLLHKSYFISRALWMFFRAWFEQSIFGRIIKNFLKLFVFGIKVWELTYFERAYLKLEADRDHRLDLMELRKSAAFTLGRIGPNAKQARPHLEELTKNSNEYPEVKSAAYYALHQIGARLASFSRHFVDETRSGQGARLGKAASSWKLEASGLQLEAISHWPLANSSEAAKGARLAIPASRLVSFVDFAGLKDYFQDLFDWDSPPGHSYKVKGGTEGYTWVKNTYKVFDPANGLLARLIHQGQARYGAEDEHTAFIVDEGIGEELIHALKAYVRAYDINQVNSTPDVDKAVEKYIKVIQGGEQVKDEERGFEHVRDVLAWLNDIDIHRKNAVVIIGGGALLDMAALAVSLHSRGVKTVIRIPTTSQSQDDSGVAVKYGINFKGKKNKVGGFGAAYGVIIDNNFLKTQDERSYRAGLIEIVKVALMKDKKFFHTLNRYYQEVLDKKFDAWEKGEGVISRLRFFLKKLFRRPVYRNKAETIINHAAWLHARQISTDWNESKSGRPLDYGHWLAHRLEKLSKHRLLHGEAVSIGVAVDSFISYGRGLLSGAELEVILDLQVNKLKLPIDDELLDGPYRAQIMKGLTEFQSHLGSKAIPLLNGLGRTVDVFDMNEKDSREEVDSAIRMIRHFKDTGTIFFTPYSISGARLSVSLVERRDELRRTRAGQEPTFASSFVTLEVNEGIAKRTASSTDVRRPSTPDNRSSTPERRSSTFSRRSSSPVTPSATTRNLDSNRSTSAATSFGVKPLVGSGISNSSITEGPSLSGNITSVNSTGARLAAEMPKINPTTTRAWRHLDGDYQRFTQQRTHLREMFRRDSQRARRFTRIFQSGETQIAVDFSKNLVNSGIKKHLISLATQTGLKKAINLMFSGGRINETEDRAALHTALRSPADSRIPVDGRNVVPDVQRVLDHMREFSEAINSGAWTGYTSKRITDVVNIGIGGSDLGPVMATEALKPYATGKVNVHFVSNVDGTDITEKVLKKLNPETTLFIIASKTFTTQETMTNAESAKKWFLDKAKDPKAVRKHFVALSTNKSVVEKFGIDSANMFEFWDWVGGRYSLWSAIGLSIAVYVGFDDFKELLAGAHDMDEHFRTAPFEDNIPVNLALLNIWYRNFFGYQSHAVLPYDQYMHRLPAYLQQAFMESNGKSVDRSGNPITYSASSNIFGEAGTNGQHSFYQQFHQGQIVPADFIGVTNSQNPLGDHHDKLLANFLAQPQALAFGKTLDEVLAEGVNLGIAPHRVFPGNRPTTSILINRLSSRALGVLISMYEHQIFAEGVIMNIFSFDQWGVELGKVKAGPILNRLKGGQEGIELDESTENLLGLIESQKGTGARLAEENLAVSQMSFGDRFYFAVEKAVLSLPTIGLWLAQSRLNRLDGDPHHERYRNYLVQKDLPILSVLRSVARQEENIPIGKINSLIVREEDDKQITHPDLKNPRQIIKKGALITASFTGARLAEFVPVNIPQNFSPALERNPYNLQAEHIEIMPLDTKAETASTVLNNPLASFAVASSASQAFGSILFASQGKEVKEVADGNAVHFAERSIQSFTEQNDKVAVVILADEGSRDLSYSLDLGSIYFKGYKTSFTGVASLQSRLDRLRAQKVRILYFVGDALEKTNGLIIPEAAASPTDSTSLFSFFEETADTILNGKNRFLIHDKFRIGGISFYAPDDAGVTPFDLPSVALKKIVGSIAKTKGIDRNSPMFRWFETGFINHATVLTLGPRQSDLQKDYERAIAKHRHQAIINDAKTLQAQYPGLKVELPGDGDLLPRVIASLGLDLDGRHLVVFGRSGSAEGIGSTIAIANIPNAQFPHSLVSAESTNSDFNSKTAYGYSSEEIGYYQDLKIQPEVYQPENPNSIRSRSKQDIKGKGVLAITSVTGASPAIFENTFADLFQRVLFIPSEDKSDKTGKAVTNTLLVTSEGSFIVRVTFQTPDLENTKQSLLTASHAARDYFDKARASKGARLATEVEQSAKVSEVRALLENADIKQAVRDFFVGLEIFQSQQGENRPLALQTDKITASPYMRVVQGDALSIQLYGKEIIPAFGLSQAKKELRNRLSEEQRTTKNNRTIEYQITRQVLAFAGLNDLGAYQGYVEVPVNVISDQLSDDKEFAEVVGFLQAYARARKGFNLFFSGVNEKILGKARFAVVDSSIGVLVDEWNSDKRTGYISLVKPENAVIAKINFVDSSRPSVPALDLKQEIAVPTAGFDGGNVANLIGAVELGQRLATVYTDIRKTHHNEIPSVADEDVVQALQKSSILGLVRELTGIKSRALAAAELHDAFTARNLASYLKFVIEPLLRYLDDRLRAIQIMQKVAVFA